MTKVYGASDDLIEFEGDVYGEVGHYGGDDEKGVLLMFSDGTLLKVVYGKPTDGGLWAIEVLRRGECFIRIDVCDVETKDGHSDIAHFGDGLKWAMVATEWGKVH